MKTIYLDNAATTKPYDDVVETMSSLMNLTYANPSSDHVLGREARNVLDHARSTIGKCINAEDASRIIFTSGGTEGDNIALIGGAEAVRRRTGRNHIVTTEVEHDAVLRTCKYLEKERGFAVTHLPVDRYGMVSTDEAKRVITKDTALVSVMAVNNELGVKQPIYSIANIAHSMGAFFHTDAVQAIGWMDIDVQRKHFDLVSFSAHKFHGPKGIGALYIGSAMSEMNMPDPVMFGGGQEYTLRSGTQNVPAIGSMAVAMKRACKDINKKVSSTSAKRNMFISYVMKNIPDVVVNGSYNESVPNIISLSFPGADAECLMIRLGQLGIMVSAGSACHASSLEPSHVLRAIHMDESLIHNTIRISLSEDTSGSELETAAVWLCKAVQDLRKMR